MAFEPPVASPHPIRIGDLVTVSRLVTVPIDKVGTVLGDGPAWPGPLALDLGDAGTLELTDPFTQEPREATTWRAEARLRGRGLRLARYTRVQLEVSAWSEGASQLVMRPVARSPHTWGSRRLRQYFDLSHQAADQLELGLRRLVRVPVSATAPPSVVETVPAQAAA